MATPGSTTPATTTTSTGHPHLEDRHRRGLHLSQILMGSHSPAWRNLTILSLFLNQAEARDKICRTIQYFSKFLSGGKPGVAQQVDWSTGLARKVFRLLKSVDELEALVTPSPKTERVPLVLLSKAKNSLMAIYLALDNSVWAGTIGIYKNPLHTDIVSNLSLYFFLGGCACSSLAELLQLVWKGDRTMTEEERKEDTEIHTLRFVRSSLDVVVAVGLLGLATKRVTPRLTGACGTVTSLITCYELFRATISSSKHTK